MRAILKTGILIAVAALVVGTTSSIATPASASIDEDEGCEEIKGFERADCQIHENFELGSEQDVRFHEGTCQGGRTTEEFEEAVPGGCENEDVISDPGNSDDHRNDDKNDD